MSFRRVVILALTCILPFAAGCRDSARHIAPPQTGSIEGSILFNGAIPQSAVIHASMDPVCAKTQKHSPYLREDKLNPRAVPPVFLWISSNIAGHSFKQTPQQTVLAVFQCRFHPQLLGVMPGQPVDFTDNDPVSANIRVTPSLSDNPSFELALRPHKPGQIRSFAHPELMIPVTWASNTDTHAYINVVLNPYFTVSGPEGHFRLRDLPPGNYSISAIRPGAPPQTQSVTIQANVATHISFTFPTVASPASGTK